MPLSADPEWRLTLKVRGSVVLHASEHGLRARMIDLLEMLDAGIQKTGPVPQLQLRAIALEGRSQRYQAGIV